MDPVLSSAGCLMPCLTAAAAVAPSLQHIAFCIIIHLTHMGAWGFIWSYDRESVSAVING